ncbi:MAG: hypothetical protein P8164_06365 [Gammaproteobacteria bacterium]
MTSLHEHLWHREGAGASCVDVVVVANLHNRPGTQHKFAPKNWAETPAFANLGVSPPEESIKTRDAAREELRELRRLFN